MTDDVSPRDALALKLRIGGRSTTQIAYELGFDSANAAHDAIGRALEARPQLSRKEQLVEHRAQLDELQAAIELGPDSMSPASAALLRKVEAQRRKLA